MVSVSKSKTSFPTQLFLVRRAERRLMKRILGNMLTDALNYIYIVDEYLSFFLK